MGFKLLVKISSTINIRWVLYCVQFFT